MNAPESLHLVVVQSRPDGRNVPIEAVGIKGIRYPVCLRSGERVVPSIATLAMTVELAPAAKGTHMSRFVELLDAQTRALDPLGFEQMAVEMLSKLSARTGSIEMRFPYFVRKAAPVSGVQSQLDYEVCWRSAVSAQGERSFGMEVRVPVTSLCPCSKEISEYGAHNQRSCIRIDAELLASVSIEELIGVAEASASCELYGLLKRPDEKYVTERAYDNPKFVEDLVRDVAVSLNEDRRIGAYVVEAENFESIHNHSAFARVTRSMA